jgi:hypothetical protein
LLSPTLQESPSSGTDLAIQVASLATLWILSTEGDASTKMLGQFLEGTYQLAMTSFGKLHAPVCCLTDNSRCDSSDPL